MNKEQKETIKMIIYQSCVIYGFKECNFGKVLNWDLLHKNDMDLFFERAETFHASEPYYGIKTDINPMTGYVRRGKVMKEAVDIFYKKVCDYCKMNGLNVPKEPEFACVLEGDLNYNLEMYSIEELKYDGIKSTIYIEVAHATANETQLIGFIKDMIQHMCSMEKMEADDFAIKNYSNSEIEHAEHFERMFSIDCKEVMSDDETEQITSKMNSVSLDPHTMLCFKLVFRHDYPKDAWAFMRKIIMIETYSEEHSWESLMFNGSYVYIHNRGHRAQIGNVWLNEGTILDCL
jgi:hypothetical protein